MQVTLTPKLEAIIQQKVDTGLFNNADEVVEEALLLLDERDRLARLKAALAVGLEQAERGEVVPWTPELMDQLIKRSEEMARQGIEPNPDVCP